MNSFFFDASALSKRYTTEPGEHLVDRIFDHAVGDRRMCLLIGAGEVASVLVRRRNDGSLSAAMFRLAWDELVREVIDAPGFMALGLADDDVRASLPFVPQHGVNITDAILLHMLVRIRALAVAVGDDVVLVASDQRLLRAAAAEGVPTFDPETRSQAELDEMLDL